MLISGMRLPNSKVSLEDASRQLLTTLMQADPRIKITHSARKLTIGGRAAILVELSGESPTVDSAGKRLTEAIRLYSLLGRSQELLYVALVSPSVDSDSLNATFD
jgi:hypothetical protein